MIDFQNGSMDLSSFVALLSEEPACPILSDKELDELLGGLYDFDGAEGMTS